MFTSKVTQKALRIVYQAYLKKKDDNNIPVVFSLYDVAKTMEDENSQTVAQLRTLLDDKKITFIELQKEFPFEISEALRVLAKDDVLSYPDFIRRIKLNPLARTVKIASLKAELKYLKKENQERHLFALKILE